jgi:diguanylate cyclase (GGDEF)-like protein
MIPAAVAVLSFACLALAALWRHAARRAREAHARLRDAEHRHTRALDAMNAFISASRVSSEAVIERIAQAVRAHDPAIDALLAFTPSGSDLACVFSVGSRAAHYDGYKVRRDASAVLPAQAARAGHRTSGFGGLVIPTDRCALAVPLHDGDALRAVIYASSAASTTIAGEDTIVRTIEHAAAPYALAVEREGDRIDATFDALTGLLTPRAFRERLREAAARLHLGGATVLTLWFIDTDRFKSVNDTFGHAAGDAVLQTMAKLICAHAVPELDIVGRNGGDEFCALIHDVQKVVAIERAQGFCEAVRRARFGIDLPITASIGVASLPYDARDANELLEVADAAMYHSKRTGRDRVSFAVNGSSFAVFR